MKQWIYIEKRYLQQLEAVRDKADKFIKHCYEDFDKAGVKSFDELQQVLAACKEVRNEKD